MRSRRSIEPTVEHEPDLIQSLVEQTNAASVAAQTVEYARAPGQDQAGRKDDAMGRR
jgi:hypothetical protein